MYSERPIGPQLRAHAPHRPVWFFKIRGCRVQDPIRNIMAAGAAHSKEGCLIDLKGLSAQQVQDMGTNPLHHAAIPLRFKDTADQYIVIFCHLCLLGEMLRKKPHKLSSGIAGCV